MPKRYAAKTDRKNGHHKAQELPDKYTPGMLARLDGRTEVARLLKDRFETVCSDLGGEPELSHLQRSLVERTIFLEAVLEDMEFQLATARQSGPGDKESASLASDIIGKWVQSLNAYVGLCTRLGLKRQRKTVDIRSYVQSNGKPAAELDKINRVVSNGDR